MASALSFCENVCRALWPDPAAASGGIALAHYRTCRVCQLFFVRDRRLVERLARLPRCPAPGVLRWRVLPPWRARPEG
jgi:hypothetical protein